MLSRPSATGATRRVPQAAKAWHTIRGIEGDVAMIRLPRRSVTRFFIPLIDVLTLLFCVFLLLPLAVPEDENADERDPAGLDEQRRQEQAELERLRRQVQET